MPPQYQKFPEGKIYNCFKKWCDEKCGGRNDEKILLAYFFRRSDKLKSPTAVWADPSILKSKLFLKDAIDLSEFSTLIAYMKRRNIRV